MTTAVRGSIPACAVSAHAQRSQANRRQRPRATDADQLEAGAVDARHRLGACASCVPHVRVVPASPQGNAGRDRRPSSERQACACVESPALKGFRGRPSGELLTPVMGGASFSEVNHLFQQSYDSIAVRRSQRRQARQSPTEMCRWRADIAQGGSEESHEGGSVSSIECINRVH